MMRWSVEIKPERPLGVVVFPEDPPPATMMFMRALTQALRNVAISSVRVLFLIRSVIWSGSLRILRMVTDAPLTASGGMITLTREPSGGGGGAHRGVLLAPGAAPGAMGGGVFLRGAAPSGFFGAPLHF